jgi:AbrB family looped-hinge helix DNA binding protein
LALPVKFQVKLTKIGNSLRITIPKPIVDGLNLEQGDILSLIVADSEIKVRKETRRSRPD